MADSPNYGIANTGPGDISFTDSPISYGAPAAGARAVPTAGRGAGTTTPVSPITNTGTGTVTVEGERLAFGPGGARRESRWDTPSGGATTPTSGGSGAGSEYAEFGDHARVRRFANEITSLGDGSEFVQVIKACHGLADASRDFGGDMNLRTRAFVDAAIAVATSGDALRDEAAIVAKLSQDLSGDE